MKLIERILIVLLAAAIISGIALAVVQNNPADQTNASSLGGGGERLRRGRGSGDGSTELPLERPRLDGSGEGANDQRRLQDHDSQEDGWLGIFRHLGVISLIVLLYWLGGRLVDRFKNRKPAKQET